MKRKKRKKKKRRDKLLNYHVKRERDVFAEEMRVGRLSCKLTEIGNYAKS